MIHIVLVLTIFSLAILGLSVGVLLSGRCLKGSCGGLAGLKDGAGRSVCEACSKASPECTGDPPHEAAQEKQSPSVY